LHLDTCTQLQVPNGTNGRVTRTVASPLTSPELLVLSAADEDGIKRQALALSEYMQSQSQTLDEKFLRNVLHTVNTRRTPLTWKAYAILDSVTSLFSLESKMEKAVRRVTASSPMKLGLVFTGQGAQWAGMGRQLLDWPVFRHSIELSQKYLSVMGCDWKIAGKWTTPGTIRYIQLTARHR
jgi:acyl transferase domain-containing protein